MKDISTLVSLPFNGPYLVTWIDDHNAHCLPFNVVVEEKLQCSIYYSDASGSSEMLKENSSAKLGNNVNLAKP